MSGHFGADREGSGDPSGNRRFYCLREPPVVRSSCPAEREASCRELWLDSLGMKAVLPPPEDREHVKTAIAVAR